MHNKNEIKVRINSDAEAEEVRVIFLDAGEKIALFSSLNEGVIGGYSYVVFSDEGWLLMLFTGDDALREVSIQQLRELLQPKQTVTIEVNAIDAPAFEMIIKALNEAREKHPLRWVGDLEKDVRTICIEESLEVLQALNDGKLDNAKLESAQRVACFVRLISGV